MAKKSTKKVITENKNYIEQAEALLLGALQKSDIYSEGTDPRKVAYKEIRKAIFLEADEIPEAEKDEEEVSDVEFGDVADEMGMESSEGEESTETEDDFVSDVKVYAKDISDLDVEAVEDLKNEINDILAKLPYTINSKFVELDTEKAKLDSIVKSFDEDEAPADDFVMPDDEENVEESEPTEDEEVMEESVMTEAEGDEETEESNEEVESTDETVEEVAKVLYLIIYESSILEGADEEDTESADELSNAVNFLKDNFDGYVDLSSEDASFLNEELEDAEGEAEAGELEAPAEEATTEEATTEIPEEGSTAESPDTTEEPAMEESVEVKSNVIKESKDGEIKKALQEKIKAKIEAKKTTVIKENVSPEIEKYVDFCVNRVKELAKDREDVYVGAYDSDEATNNNIFQLVAQKLIGSEYEVDVPASKKFFVGKDTDVIHFKIKKVKKESKQDKISAIKARIKSIKESKKEDLSIDAIKAKIQAKKASVVKEIKKEGLFSMIVGGLSIPFIKRKMKKSGINLSDEGEIAGYLKDNYPKISLRDAIEYASMFKENKVEAIKAKVEAKKAELRKESTNGKFKAIQEKIRFEKIKKLKEMIK